MLSVVPPAEGPAEIDAAFRQIGVDLVEQEARQDTEDAVSTIGATQDRTEVDDFWSTYEAGL
jgi:hypothetical protein